MSEIKAGSTVRLKSGGPLMTVTYLTAGSYAADDAVPDKAHCQWFGSAGGKPDSETFPLVALVCLD